MAPPLTGDRWIGTSLPRVEDRRLLTGQGQFTDDRAGSADLFACFVRSPHPSALIGAIDSDAARSMPGVKAILTAADYHADGLKPILHRPNPAAAVDHTQRAFDPDRVVDLPHWPLARTSVRYLGEPVAVVLARSAAEAQDAAESVDIDYAPGPAVIDVDGANAKGSVPIHAEAPDNICVAETFGDTTAVETAFSHAANTVRKTFRHSRIANCQMEPRSVSAYIDGDDDVLTVVAGCQGVMRIKDGLCHSLGLHADGVRIICPDVGGGFGPRSFVYAEMVVVAWAARRLGLAVRWTATRAESLLTDYQGRDSRIDAGLALDDAGKFLALDIRLVSDVGAHTVAFVPMANASSIVTTVYDIPVVSVAVTGVMTNTVPTAPYRGAGRPEATNALEQLIDLAATRFGFDRIDLRRQNLLRRTQLPYRTARGLTYDSGDFTGNMTTVLAASRWHDFENRRATAAVQGKLSGIGLANYIGSPVGDPRERLSLVINAEGTVDLVTGTQSTGQGHETTFAQVAAELLQVPMTAIRFKSGDSRFVTAGGGTHSDRSMRIIGTLLVEAATEIIAAGKAACALIWNVVSDAVFYEDGYFRHPGRNDTITLFGLAAELDAIGAPPLTSMQSFQGRLPAHPTGAAVCELEIDPETGTIEFTRYTTVDDVGRVVNPMIVDGQVHGGIAQGVGEAIMEKIACDAGSGQVLTGSFMDYCLPRADDLPPFDVSLIEDPTPANPLAIKGGGEAGITPASAAIANAIVDALKAFNPPPIRFPVTSEWIWQTVSRSRT